MHRWLCVCALIVSVATPARADVLNAGSKLRITFRVDPATPAPDYFSINMGAVQVLSPYGVRSAALYDGSTLLGTYSSSLYGNFAGLVNLDPGATWKSASSQYTFDSPVVVPFGSLSNGTIHGAIEFTIQSGAMDIALNQVNLVLIQSQGPSVGFISHPPPTLESICIETGDFTNFCAGDGSGTACPCGNDALIGSDTGCTSSLSMGARLQACGAASVSADTFVLRGSQMPNSSVLYFQGTGRRNQGSGSTFGDGLRCAGGTIVRLGAASNVFGASQYPSLGDVAISIKGALSAGSVRTYQAWYRNAAAFCTSSTFNLSNGVEVTWGS